MAVQVLESLSYNSSNLLPWCDSEGKLRRAEDGQNRRKQGGRELDPVLGQGWEGDIQGWPNLRTCRGLCGETCSLTPGCSWEGQPGSWRRRGGGKAWLSQPWRASAHQHFPLGGSMEEQKELGPSPDLVNCMTIVTSSRKWELDLNRPTALFPKGHEDQMI